MRDCAARLHEQARQCRELADAVRWDEAADMLNRLGDELDDAALRLDARAVRQTAGA
jgi:hypothetical protein